MDKKPFDFQKVRVVIKRGSLGDKEIMLDKKWTYDTIAHFRPVIEGVSDDEGIEITLTCNLEAFEFIIKYLQAQTLEEHENLMMEVNYDNCLNIIVTADFLKLPEVYEGIWDGYFAPNFVEIIDKCTLNLSSIC